MLAVPSRTLGKIGILSGEAETKRGLAELLGADDDLAIAGSAEILFNVPPQRQKIGRIINKGMRLLACAILVGVTLRPAVKPSAQGKGMKAVNQSILR